MPRVGLIVLTLALTACTPGAGSPSLAPPSSNPATSGGATGLCIDRGQLADSGDSVMVALQGVVAALKISNSDQARSLAGTAASGMKSIADLVGPVQPDAEKAFRSAADTLDSATSAFPGGLSQVEDAQKDFGAALLLARTAACPE